MFEILVYRGFLSRVTGLQQFVTKSAGYIDTVLFTTADAESWRLIFVSRVWGAAVYQRSSWLCRTHQTWLKKEIKAFQNNKWTQMYHRPTDQWEANLKVKVCVYSPNIPVASADFTLITPRYWYSFLHTHLLGENAMQFSGVAAIHAVPIFIPPGTHYCWVDRGNPYSKLGQDISTLAPRE